MKGILVFYAGMLYAECNGLDGLKLIQTTCGPEIYNGAYVYIPTPPRRHYERKWYRMDLTPLLLIDVPKALQAYILILHD